MFKLKSIVGNSPAKRLKILFENHGEIDFHLARSNSLDKCAHSESGEVGKHGNYERNRAGNGHDELTVTPGDKLELKVEGKALYELRIS